MRTLTSLILLSSLAIIIAQDCSNPLLSTYGLTGLASPQTISGLPYCKSLQAGQTCCSSDTINGFQTQINTLSATLATAVAARDKYLTQSRDNDIPNIQTGLQQLKTLAATAIAKIAAKTQSDKSADTSSVTDGTATILIQSLENISGDIGDNLATLKSNFMTYQKSRTTCVVELLNLQAAAWCLACDPNYATKGVVSGPSITLSTDVCTRLQSSCYNYLSGADAQSAIMSAESISSIITQLAASLTKIGNADNSGKDDLKTALDGITQNSAATTDKQASALPAACTSASSCSWICSNLFSGTQIVQSAITIGGAVDTELSSTAAATAAGGSRLLEEGRMLDNVFNPASDEAGVTVTFADDPAGVDPSTSGSDMAKSGVVGVIVMMLSAFYV